MKLVLIIILKQFTEYYSSLPLSVECPGMCLMYSVTLERYIKQTSHKVVFNIHLFQLSFISNV